LCGCGGDGVGLVDYALHDVLLFRAEVCGEGFVELGLFLLELYNGHALISVGLPQGKWGKVFLGLTHERVLEELVGFHFIEGRFKEAFFAEFVIRVVF